jgi:hypothetical protein
MDEAERRQQLQRIRMERRAKELSKPDALNMSLDAVPMAESRASSGAVPSISSARSQVEIDCEIDRSANEMVDDMFDTASGEMEVILGSDAAPTKALPQLRLSSAPPQVEAPQVEEEQAGEWKVGQQVEAVWLEDEVFYVAEVISFDRAANTYEVLFCEYGNRQPNTPASLIRQLSSEEQLAELGLAVESDFSAEALSPADWLALTDRIARQLKVRDCDVGGEVYRRVFDGYAAVTWLVETETEIVRSRKGLQAKKRKNFFYFFYDFCRCSSCLSTYA